MKKNITLQIPEHLNEITLDQYQKWAIVDKNDREAGAKDYTPSYFAIQKCVSIFCNKPLLLISKYVVHKELMIAYNLIINLINGEEKGQFEQVFKFRGLEFGLEPNFEKMPSGVYADCSAYLGEVSEWHKLMGALYRPIYSKHYNKILKIEQYILEEYKGNHEHSFIFKSLPMDKVLGAVFFLISCYKILQSDLMDYLDREVATNPELKKGLERSGHGTASLISFRSITDILMTKLPI